MSYDHLAAGLKEVLLNDKSAFDADRLQKYTGENATKQSASFNVFFTILSEHFLHQVVKNYLSVRQYEDVSNRIKT